MGILLAPILKFVLFRSLLEINIKGLEKFLLIGPVLRRFNFSA
jgi:hypothetical protein